MDTDAFRISLYASASNAASLTLSTIGSATNEVSGLGYSSGGKPLTGATWATGASAREMRFNANPLLWSGPINAVKFAVISKDGTSAAQRKLLCVVQLSTSQFNVGAGVPLAIAPPGTGIFELN
jgi:hypothetical protein